MTKKYQQSEAGFELIKGNRGIRAKLSIKSCGILVGFYDTSVYLLHEDLC